MEINEQQNPWKVISSEKKYDNNWINEIINKVERNEIKALEAKAFIIKKLNDYKH